MGAGAILVVATLVFAARHVGALLLGLVGLALVAAGAWWVVTEEMPRRAIGIAGAVVGAVLVVVAVLIATSAADQPWLRLVLVARCRGHGACPAGPRWSPTSTSGIAAGLRTSPARAIRC